MREIVYKDRICEKCGAKYSPTSSTQRWCSACLEKICEYCGQTYSVGKRSRYENSRFCSKECLRRATAEKQRGENHPGYRDGSRCTTVKIKCTVCGKEILREKGQAARWATHFCSTQCRSVYQKGKNTGEENPRYARVEKVCDWCGRTFQAWPSVQEKAKFCSKQCRNNWQSDMMSGEKHYNWKGGTAEKRSCDMVSRTYKAWRKAVFERDNYTCQMCGDRKGGNLNAHHIKPYKDYPDLRYEISNGTTLCKQCHIKIHQQIDIQSELRE